MNDAERADPKMGAAERAHQYVKYHHEQAVERYAPHVPPITTLLIPPKGRYCNADYDEFCPALLWGGFCTECNKALTACDGARFVTITSYQFWACRGEADQPHRPNAAGVAVGAYKVFRKCKTCRDNSNWEFL